MQLEGHAADYHDNFDFMHAATHLLPAENYWAGANAGLHDLYAESARQAVDHQVEHGCPGEPS